MSALKREQKNKTNDKHNKTIRQINNKSNEMNKELEKLHEWLCINRLSLNISKTNFVIFHPINKPKVPVTILINKEAIDEEKYV